MSTNCLTAPLILIINYLLIRNLSFAYPGQTTPTLKNINLIIEPGETLAIVGFNGGGKTTLVKVRYLRCLF